MESINIEDSLCKNEQGKHNKETKEMERRRGAASERFESFQSRDSGVQSASKRVLNASQRLEPLRQSSTSLQQHNLQALESFSKRAAFQSKKPITRRDVSAEEPASSSEEDEESDLDSECEDHDKLRNMPLICFGNNTRDQLGMGDKNAVHYDGPQGVKDLDPEFRVGCVATSKSCTFITHESKGYLYMSNEHTNGRFSPVETGGTFVLDVVTTGEAHFIITGKRTLLSWGKNRFGELGRDSTPSTPASFPCPVNALTSHRIAQVAVGTAHVLALLTAGIVFSWGRNHHGQLGLGHVQNLSAPRQVDFLDGCRVVSVAAYANQSAALGDSQLAKHFEKKVNLKQKKRVVFTWGSAETSRLGHSRLDGDKKFREERADLPCGKPRERASDPKTCSLPCFIPDLVDTEKPVTKVVLGEQHGVCLIGTGQVYTWGANMYGQLGLGHHYEEARPVLVENLSNVVEIAAGQFHSVFLTSQGIVYTCGYNHYGELGLRDTKIRTSPTPLSELMKEGVKPSGVACGAAYTMLWNKVTAKDTQLCFQDHLRQRQCRLTNKIDPNAPPTTVRRDAESDGYAYMALAGPGVVKGSYEWRVQVDKITNEDFAIGIGVAPGTQMDPFMFDLFDQGPCWLFLTNGDKYHAGDIESYNDKVYEKDIIGVHLNLDLGTLHFSRRGKNLGLCYYLAASEPLFLCVSLPSQDDQVTILAEEEEDINELVDPGTQVCFNAHGLLKTSGNEVFYRCGPCKILVCRACARHCKHSKHFTQIVINHHAATEHCQCNPITCTCRDTV